MKKFKIVVSLVMVFAMIATGLTAFAAAAKTDKELYKENYANYKNYYKRVYKPEYKIEQKVHIRDPAQHHDKSSACKECSDHRGCYQCVKP